MRRLASFLTVLLLLALSRPAQAVTQIIKQSSQSVIGFLLVDSATGQTGQTGQVSSITVYISKNGGPASLGTGTLLEADAVHEPGIYTYTPSTTETNTLGIIFLHITCSGSQAVDTSAQIVAFDPNDSVKLGLTVFPANFSALSISVGGIASASVSAYATGQDPATLLFADTRIKKLYSYNVGKYTFNPSTGVISFFDTDGLTNLFTLTLTKDGQGNVISRQ